MDMISGTYKLVRYENVEAYLLARGSTPAEALRMTRDLKTRYKPLEKITKNGTDNFVIKNRAGVVVSKHLEFKLGETFNELLTTDGVQYQSTFTMEGENKLKQIQKCLTWDGPALVIWREFNNIGMKMTCEAPNSGATMTSYFKKIR